MNAPEARLARLLDQHRWPPTALGRCCCSACFAAMGPSLPGPLSKLLSGLCCRPCREALSYTSHPAGPPFTASAQKLHCPLAPDSEAHWPLVSQMPTSDLGSEVILSIHCVWGGGCAPTIPNCVTRSPRKPRPHGTGESPEVGQRLRRWGMVGYLRTAVGGWGRGGGEPVLFTPSQSLPKPQGTRGL